MECDRYSATSSLIVRSLSSQLRLPRAGSSRLGGRLGVRPEIGAEVVGHQRDLFLRPQPAAPDHAVDRRLPSAAILALIAEHRVGMALEALAHHHAATGMLRAWGALLRLRGGPQPRQRAYERTSEISPDDHRVSLRTFFLERNRFRSNRDLAPSVC